MKIAVSLMFVILASCHFSLAAAQDAGQLPVASFCPLDPSENSVSVTDAHVGDANWVRPNERLQPGLSMLGPVACTSATSDKQQSAAPTFPNSQDGGLCGLGPICNCNSCPCFYVEVEGLFLARQSLFNHQNVVVDPNTGRSFLSTSDVDLGFDPGVRVTAGMRLCGGMALELSYLGLFGGNASASATKPDPNAFLTLGGNLVGNVFVDLNGAQMTDSSWLQSLEINLPCCCGCCDDCRDACGCGELRCQSFEWFTGFRYLAVGDELNLNAERVVAGAIEEGNYNIRTVNHLYGVQVGARWRRTWGRIGWEAKVEAGVFANDMEETQTVTDFPNFPLRPTVSGSEVGVAFVGELDLSAIYRLTDVWNVKAGYTLIGIQGLALGPDQLDFAFAASPSGNEVHNGGGMILQGLNLGVEARW